LIVSQVRNRIWRCRRPRSPLVCSSKNRIDAYVTCSFRVCMARWRCDIDMTRSRTGVRGDGLLPMHALGCWVVRRGATREYVLRPSRCSRPCAPPRRLRVASRAPLVLGGSCPRRLPRLVRWVVRRSRAVPGFNHFRRGIGIHRARRPPGSSLRADAWERRRPPCAMRQRTFLLPNSRLQVSCLVRWSELCLTSSSY
jgi:hypothetical protein